MIRISTENDYMIKMLVEWFVMHQTDESCPDASWNKKLCM